jgi:hypothetical protein
VNHCLHILTSTPHSEDSELTRIQAIRLEAIATTRVMGILQRAKGTAAAFPKLETVVLSDTIPAIEQDGNSPEAPGILDQPGQTLF